MIRARWLFGAAAVGSVLLHGAAILALLPHGAGPEAVEEPPAIEIELVDQAGQTKGAPQTDPSPPQPPAAQPAPSMAPSVSPTVQLPPPQPPARPPRPEQRAAAVNLGDSDQDQEPLTVSGDNVVPPRPDAAMHNKPPAYPPDAARRRREGVVLLRARVTEAGVPAWVDVLSSSGDQSLDRSAREAVSLWRFQPARNKGVAVPFDYDVNIRFSLGEGAVR